ncbi:F-box/LRR-repeat protein At1g06630 [Capsella rubella]|nr:F-box/LRR-repeat protein At1g06630 [Capsella rubella]
MSLDAPNLLFLDYCHYPMSVYPHVNLASLVEARLDIQYSTNMDDVPDITGLIVGISNVKTLHLSPGSVDLIFRCVKYGLLGLKINRKVGLLLPVFNNLVSLSFGSKNETDWKLLPYLIEQSPKLESLTIQGLDSYTCDSTMHLFQVKVLRVLGYGGTAKESEHLKKFIGESECLEVVLVDDVM